MESSNFMLQGRAPRAEEVVGLEPLWAAPPDDGMLELFDEEAALELEEQEEVATPPSRNAAGLKAGDCLLAGGLPPGAVLFIRPLSVPLAQRWCSAWPTCKMLQARW